MNPRLVEYYNRELAYLRELGAEFAAAFPKIAGRLSLRELEVADPYVERLLEGFSFLTARVQMKMDAEFPRLSQRILEMVCPHYLAPTPAMVVVQLDPSTREGSLPEGYTLPAGSQLRARRGADDATPCDFRTGHALTLWPLDLAAARLAGPPLHLPASQLRLPREAAGHLRLELATRGALPLSQLRLDRLELFIAADDVLASRLQELLHGALLGIAVHDADDATRVHAVLPPQALQAEGYAQEQALLPYSLRGFQGHRLLHEYFAFPERLRFLSISGLAPVLARVPQPRVALTLLFDRAVPALEPMVDAGKLLLHCVPAINLFEREADRIHLSPSVNEYHVVVDRTRPRDFEVYAVQAVTGHQQGQLGEREFQPLYAAVHGIRPEQQAYFAVRREPRLLSESATRFGPRTQYLGSEVFLSLVDQQHAPFSDALQQLGVRTLCTNRDLPLLLTGDGADGSFHVVASAPVRAVRLVAGPSRPVPSMADNAITWRLISHLSLNYLALSDRTDEEGAATLRDLLRLYAELGERAVAGQIASVKALSIAPITRRLPQHGPLVYGRGVGVALTVDELPLAGVSPWPLAAVLERFLARHVGVNSFTELALHSRQRGRVAQWQVQPGQRPVA
ncbi:type VI secretion system baseplate subunit TssF [Pseudorhodoferax sp.]|uniref:type VI secretion system baseplate subunit TssF n=1 Tax=Pseudorhodoferax sp. TaxID=1993553 RepID=UPI002DD6497C|nr:type VI secretion system baseplate subunit TssF [Pseudorhodoferax sp.]